MKRTIDVCIGDAGRLVGRLHYNQDGRRESAIFEYDQSWLASPDRFAIDPALPLVPERQFRRKSDGGSVFTGAIADTEPDGWAMRVIRRDHAKRRGNPDPLDRVALPPILGGLDFLLAVDDYSRLGALRFRDERHDFCRTPAAGQRRAPPLIELRQMLASTHAVETDTETAEDLAYLRGRGTSLGGMRPKCTVVDDRGQLLIAKFPSIQDSGPVTAGEVLALRLARAAGIDAAEADLIDSEGTPVALIRRFDRSKADRIPYLSAATLLQAEPDDGAEHAYTELVDEMRRHAADPTRDIVELWRRIVFSVLITNTDDHLRNHGFLHAGGDLWRLAPAFDLNPFPGRARELKTWISEEAGPSATIDGALSALPRFGIPLATAREILMEVDAAVSTWRTIGRSLGMTARDLDYFAEAFEHGERVGNRSR